MTTQQLNDKILEKYPFVWRNNRGAALAEYGKHKRLIRYGIPTPRTKEKDTDYKGGDFIGINSENGKFINIETKGDRDIIKPGQIKWHNFIIDNNGISEIWLGDGRIINYKISEDFKL